MQQRQSLAAIGQRYTDIVWAAGLFEGEGYIYTNPSSKCRCIGIEMTDKDVMQKYVAVVGYGQLNPRKTVPANRKQSWRWDIGKRLEVSRILKMFLPHFGKRRAEKAIEAITHIHETIN